MKMAMILASILCANLAFAKTTINTRCVSTVNIENSFDLRIEDGEIVWAQLFMEYSQTTGEMKKVADLNNDRTRFLFVSANTPEAFDVDNSVLSTGAGAMSFKGNAQSDFDCTAQ